jgi:GalNAc-alpha-(1->4)-GalNAc-alpha-(1->3)-diNAcBac-PP-undecaprenol alpha-1,4-N-acetyl-D-galactosaminyltransferase
MLKVKICLVIPSLRNGGSERVMSELANKWASIKNIEVYLILLTNQEQFYKIDARVKIVTPSRNYKNNFLSKGFFKIWTFYYIRSTCNKIQPTSLLSFSERYNNIVLLSLLGTKFKKYVSDRNSPYMNIGKLHTFLRNLLYKGATGIIAQTSTAKKELHKNTKNTNIRVVPNPLRKIEDIGIKNLKNKIILNVGRNVPQKNQLELLEIFSRCDLSGWTLQIIGNGPLKDVLIQKSKELGISKNVHILGFSKDIDSFYREASIFAFSSLYEGFPNALNEAMAHGLACVSYDCPTGPKDIIKDGYNGMLVDLGNKDSFQQKMNELMLSEKLREQFSDRAREIKEIYSLNKITDNYLNFILDDEVNN